MAQETGLQRFYRTIIPKATSIGAAVVVLGALFKIMHWPGAGPMLIVGLLTESVIFLFGVFEPAQPPNPHYEWERVYPGLVDANVKAVVAKKGDDGKDVALMAGLDKMLGEANLTADSFKRFGQGIQSLNDTATRMKSITKAVNSTNDYSNNLKQASIAYKP